MNRSARRRAKAQASLAGARSLDQIAAKIVEHVFDGGGTSLCIGPLVCKTDDNRNVPDWYFVIGSGGPDFSDTFRCDCFGARDKENAENLRNAFCAALVGRAGTVIHTFDDELELCRWCETIWPGEKIRTIRAGIEAERANEGNA